MKKVILLVIAFMTCIFAKGQQKAIGAHIKNDSTLQRLYHEFHTLLNERDIYHHDMLALSKTKPLKIESYKKSARMYYFLCVKINDLTEDITKEKCKIGAVNQKRTNQDLARIRKDRDRLLKERQSDPYLKT